MPEIITQNLEWISIAIYCLGLGALIAAVLLALSCTVLCVTAFIVAACKLIRGRIIDTYDYAKEIWYVRCWMAFKNKGCYTRSDLRRLFSNAIAEHDNMYMVAVNNANYADIMLLVENIDHSAVKELLAKWRKNRSN